MCHYNVICVWVPVVAEELPLCCSPTCALEEGMSPFILPSSKLQLSLVTAAFITHLAIHITIVVGRYDICPTFLAVEGLITKVGTSYLR